MSDTGPLLNQFRMPLSVLSRWVVGGWSSLVLIPAAIWHGGGETRLLALAAGAYIGGWIFLTIGWNRDPNMERVSQYARSQSACVVFLAACSILPIMAFTVGVVAALIVLLTVGAGFLGLWSLKRTVDGLRDTINHLMVMFASLLFMAGAGEVLLSLPPVATRILPPAFVRACRDTWEREKYDRLWERNPHSFRSFHLDAPKREGAFRIITLGDSFTWGDKIAFTRDTWPYVLEKACAAKRPGVQVINLAKCGFTTVNEEEMLHRFGGEFKPDLVILQYYLNDSLPSGPGFQAKGEDWMQAPTWPLLPYMHRTLDRHSYLYSLLNRGFSRLQQKCLKFKVMTYADLFDDRFLGWQENKRALRNMAEIGKKAVPVLLVVFPSFLGDLDDSSYPYLALHAKVMSAATELGLPALDLRPVFARRDSHGPSWWAISLDSHPGLRAHRVAGETIAEEIRRRGFLSNGTKRSSVN